MTSTSHLIVPTHLFNDHYWKGTLYLFNQHPKLNKLFTTQYFDFEEGNVAGELMLKSARAWSTSEKVMLNLALHLYNERYSFNMHDLDYLDSSNKELAYQAIKFKFF